MTIGERIRQVRESHGEQREELALKLGVSMYTLTAWENGARNPKPSATKLISEIYSVRESWLTHGEGSMEVLPSEIDNRISNFLAQIQAVPDDDFRKQFIDVLSNIPFEKWKVIEECAKVVLDAADKTKK